MTAAEFEKVTGVPPVQDDLERVNCDKAGELGHLSCGVCDCGMPMFMCGECFRERTTS